MALTQEQLDNLEWQKAQAALNQVESLKARRMEAVRIAREVLAENDRNKPVGDRGITAQDITTFAESIVAYVNQ